MFLLLILLTAISGSTHASDLFDDQKVKRIDLNASTDFLGNIEYIAPSVFAANQYTINCEKYLLPPADDTAQLLKVFNDHLRANVNEFELHGYFDEDDASDSEATTIREKISIFEPYDFFEFGYDIKDGYGPFIKDCENPNHYAADRVFYLAKRNNSKDVIGAIVFYIYFQDDIIHSVISGLHIVDKYRNNGLGEILFQFAVCTALLNGSYTISLTATNMGYNLYKKNGFKKEDDKKELDFNFNYYLNWEEFYNRLKQTIKNIDTFPLEIKFKKITQLAEFFSRSSQGGMFTPGELAIFQEQVAIPDEINTRMIDLLNHRLIVNPSFYLKLKRFNNHEVKNFKRLKTDR